MNALRSSALKSTGLEYSVLVMRILSVAFVPLIAVTGSYRKRIIRRAPMAGSQIVLSRRGIVDGSTSVLVLPRSTDPRNGNPFAAAVM
jgi:hypothetical protein